MKAKEDSEEKNSLEIRTGYDFQDLFVVKGKGTLVQFMVHQRA